MNTKTKKLLATLIDALHNENPTKITRTEAPLSGGSKKTYLGDFGIKFEVRFREGQSLELFARGEVLKDLELLHYASSGEAGKPTTVDQVLEIFCRMLGQTPPVAPKFRPAKPKDFTCPVHRVFVERRLRVTTDLQSGKKNVSEDFMSCPQNKECGWHVHFSGGVSCPTKYDGK